MLKNDLPNTVYFKLGSGDFVVVEVPATLEQLKDLKRVIFAREKERVSREFDKIWNNALPSIKATLWDITHDETN